MPLSLDFEFSEKQAEVFLTDGTEIMYGGAAGGGKSALIRRALIIWCLEIPGLQCYLFRRTFPDLRSNHMEGVDGFPALLAPMLSVKTAKIKSGNHNSIEFKNGKHGGFEGGSAIKLNHCQYEKDVINYQGAEIHVLVFDELTHFTKYIYSYLRSRVRKSLAGLDIPAKYRGLFPKILSGTNPGNVGHNWVKSDFVDVAPPGVVTQMPEEEGGMKRVYIPALLEDNPYMDAGEYRGKLAGLGDPALVKAMLEGDWNIVVGGMFDDLWNPSYHVLDPFDIPASWYIDRTFDWGSSKPFACIWWAESDGSTVRMADGTERTFPRGTLFAIKEWYGWEPGKPNVGLKMPDKEIALGIKDQEAYMEVFEYKADQFTGQRKKVFHKMSVYPGSADNAIFDVSNNGYSIAKEMAKYGIRWTNANKNPGSRINGWSLIRSYLKAARQHPMEHPGLFIFNSCPQIIRTLPTLPRDSRKPDDVNTEAEDHLGDGIRYRILKPEAPKMGTMEIKWPT